MEEKVILVNKNDKAVGVGEKMKVHLQGKLHRAFSIFLFNKKGEILIQKRAKSKYHSPNLWSNSCCSHSRSGENLEKAIQRNLKEEMGINCPLKEIGNLIYKVRVGSLIEHEFDHIFFGQFDGKPKPNKKEVKDWKWIKISHLKKEIKENPRKYTPWFRIILTKVKFKL